jgi:hypothetical protein
MARRLRFGILTRFVKNKRREWLVVEEQNTRTPVQERIIMTVLKVQEDRDKKMDSARDELDRRSFRSIWRGGAVLAGALVMTWPALYNQFPLLYPDSMSYLEDGPLVARALFLHKFSTDYGGR